MALKMAQPWKDSASGIYHLRQRTPLDLVASAKGQMVSLPVGDEVVAVKVGPLVQVSLRTKDADEAKLRHAAADAALKTQWAALRKGPQGLTHKQAVALAGWVYRAAKGVFENEPHFSRKFIQLEESRRAFESEAIRNATPAAEAEVELIETSATHPADLRAEYLARWVREAACLDDYGVSPNHGWRHTFKSKLMEQGILERISDAITGHSAKGVARAYGTPTLETMAKAISKLPRYVPC